MLAQIKKPANNNALYCNLKISLNKNKREREEIRIRCLFKLNKVFFESLNVLDLKFYRVSWTYILVKVIKKQTSLHALLCY